MTHSQLVASLLAVSHLVNEIVDDLNDPFLAVGRVDLHGEVLLAHQDGEAAPNLPGLVALFLRPQADKQIPRPVALLGQLPDNIAILEPDEGGDLVVQKRAAKGLRVKDVLERKERHEMERTCWLVRLSRGGGSNEMGMETIEVEQPHQPSTNRGNSTKPGHRIDANYQ